ncbi:MAG: hypothetical protein PHW74_07825 [Desulfobacca sp.]|nr:hypothetical protein [Desulfobacca sp.]
MFGRPNPFWAALCLLVFITGGCSGIIAEEQRSDGNIERIKVGPGGYSWKTWDHNPQKKDDGAVMIKKESTF